MTVHFTPEYGARPFRGTFERYVFVDGRGYAALFGERSGFRLVNLRLLAEKTLAKLPALTTNGVEG